MKSIIKKNKVIINNFFSLSLLNVVNLLTPIITLPYLIEVLGVEGYGKYAFGYSLLMYALVVVNFGFNFSATQDVAINRTDNYKLSKIFTEVLIIRTSLAVITVLLIYLALISINKLNETASLILLGSGIVFGTILIPNYLYQGLEKMKYITIASSIPKVVMILSIFFVIKTEKDIGLLMIIQSIGFIISGIVSTIISYRIIEINIIKTNIKDLIKRTSKSLNLFYSTAGMSLYRESGTVILGLFSSYEFVGYYSASEKIIRAIQAILNPVAQSIFPHFASKFTKDRNQKKTALKSFSRFLKYYSLILIPITLSVIFILPFIIKYFTGDKYTNSITNIKILSPLVFFGCLNFIVGIVGLVNLGYEKYFTKAVLYSGILAIVLSLLLVRFLDDKGIAISLTITEIFLFCYVYKKLISIK